MFAAALVAVACVIAENFHSYGGWVAGAVIACTGGQILGWRLGLAWLLCGWLSVAGFVWREADRLGVVKILLENHGNGLKGRVIKDAQGTKHSWSAPVVLIDGECPGARVVWQGKGEPPVAGAVVSGRGNFGPIPEIRNPGEFDRANWLKRQGVAAVFMSEGLDEVETGRLALLGSRIRQGFRERVTTGLPDDSQEANVIRAVVIGETPPDADSLVRAFRNSGTLHAFSVSGLHVAMVGSIGWFLLSWAGVPRRWAVLFLIPLVFGYSWITGNSPPAVRSAWMATVFLGAFVFRLRPDLLNVLGIVLLGTMLWDGRMLFQPGVQLSYGVVAAIAVGTAWTSSLFRWMAVPEPYLPRRRMSWLQVGWLRLRKNTSQSLGVSVAAAAGSAPLTAYHFGMVTPVSILASLVLVPQVFVLLVGGLVCVAVSPLPLLARPVSRINSWFANTTVFSAEAFSSIPGGHFHVCRDESPKLLVYDLERGDGAACFSGGGDRSVLMDCGGRQSFRHSLMPSLRQLGIEPDSVVISHPDSGHLGGGTAVWTAFPIRQALVPVFVSRSPVYKAWIRDAPKAGIQISLADESRLIGFPDGASLETLHAPDAYKKNVVADEQVAVFRLHWHGWKMLFTSDAGMRTEMKMLDSGKDLSADIIIAGHHRTDLSLCEPFLNAVHPQVIIATNSQFPVEERRDPGTMDYWRSRGIKVIDLSKSGGVTLRVDKVGNLRIEGFLNSSPIVLEKRENQ